MSWSNRQKSRSSSKLRNGEVIALENFEVPIKFRRNKRARRLTLRVSAANRSAILTVPQSCSDTETLSFLEGHRSWLHQQFEKIPEAVPFAQGTHIPLRGTPHELIYAGKSRGKGVVWTTDEGATPQLHITGTPEFAPRRLKNWLIKQARQDLHDRTNWHAKNLGLGYKKIMIKDTRSRWGSCSSNGVLSYSWRLIMAPSFVLDYVAAHEVCHLEEMNHGPNFWKLVEKTLPSFEPAKNWLREQGTNLHRYGAEE